MPHLGILEWSTLHSFQGKSAKLQNLCSFYTFTDKWTESIMNTIVIAMSSPTPVSSVPHCTTTVKPDRNGWVPPGTCGYYGKMYYPSFSVAVGFSALAGAILLSHFTKAVRHPKSVHQRLAVLASTCLFVGYVARTIGTRYQQNIHIAAISDTMILVSPIC